MARSNKDFLAPRRGAKSRSLFDFSSEDIHQDVEKTDYSETDRYLNTKLDQANQNLRDLETKIEKIEKTTKAKIDRELVSLKQQIDESKSRVVETLALFAALFTFLSLQVQIFKDQNDVDKVVGLVLITGGLITFFVLILDIMIKTKADAENLLKTRFFLLLVVSLLLIACGVLVMKQGL